jgi:hypothetical protein
MYVSRMRMRTCMPLLAICAVREQVRGMCGWEPAIADSCAGVPAVGVATAVTREGVALVLAART